jgi:hypothetical protein
MTIYARSGSAYLRNRLPVAGRSFTLLANDPSSPLFSSGWSPVEEWGRWNEGPVSAMTIILAPGSAYRLIIEAFPFCPDQAARQTVRVSWNDTLLGVMAFDGCTAQMLELEIPDDAPTGQVDAITFEYGYTASPADVSESSDGRSLAVGLVSITFAPLAP